MDAPLVSAEHAFQLAAHLRIGVTQSRFEGEILVDAAAVIQNLVAEYTAFASATNVAHLRPIVPHDLEGMANHIAALGAAHQGEPIPGNSFLVIADDIDTLMLACAQTRQGTAPRDPHTSAPRDTAVTGGSGSSSRETGERIIDAQAFIREDIAALRAAAARDGAKPPHVYDELADASLVRHATDAMREKLALARSHGRGGWWNDKECSIDHLRSLLREHVEKGDMRDVMNLAAMVYVREMADMKPSA